MSKLIWLAGYFLDLLNKSNHEAPCIEKATAILKCEAIIDLLEKADKSTIVKIKEDFYCESKKKAGTCLGVGANT